LSTSTFDYQITSRSIVDILIKQQSNNYLVSDTYSLQFVNEFIPSLKEVAPSVLDALSSKLEKQMPNNSEIKGVILLSTNSKSSPNLYARKLSEYKWIQQIAEMLHERDLRQLKQKLSAFSYHGSKVLTRKKLGLGMVKINDNDVLVLITNSSVDSLDSSSMLIMSILIDSYLPQTSSSVLSALPNPKQRVRKKKIEVTPPGIPRPQAN